MHEEAIKFVFRTFYGITSAPTEADHEAALKAVMICAKGDGVLDPKEQAWISGTAAMVGNPFYEIAYTYAADQSIEEVVESSSWLKNYGGRMIIYEAVRAAGADGELHPDELDVIQRLAAALGVDKEIVAQLIELHHDEVRLNERRIQTLWPESSPLHE